MGHDQNADGALHVDIGRRGSKHARQEPVEVLGHEIDPLATKAECGNSRNTTPRFFSSTDDSRTRSASAVRMSCSTVSPSRSMATFHASNGKCDAYLVTMLASASCDTGEACLWRELSHCHNQFVSRFFSFRKVDCISYISTPTASDIVGQTFNNLKMRDVDVRSSSNLAAYDFEHPCKASSDHPLNSSSNDFSFIAWSLVVAETFRAVAEDLRQR
ncbi:hypothetical protein BC828DRAFT_386426 [Blastocladiella britannica]|nr:hypothetical protein BC828DRAFT_386426 [Blastocladiella britannica]